MLSLRGWSAASRSPSLAIFLALMFYARVEVAAADEPQRSCPAPGTRMALSNGVTIKFESSDGLTCNIENLKTGRSFSFYGLVWNPNSPPDNDSEVKKAIDKLWPFAVGKSVEFDANWGQIFWSEKITVIRQASLSVPAGTFDVYVVTVDNNCVMGGPKGSHDQATYYISPKVGFLVKREYARVAGNPSPGPVWEATSIATP